MNGMFLRFALIVFFLAPSFVSAGQGALPEHPFDYDYEAQAKLAETIDLDDLEPELLRRTFAERRQRVLQSIPDGAMLIFSVERAQPRRLEFQVPHSENHDFIYLTGVEGLDSLDSALLLLPTEDGNRVVLYTSSDPERIRRMTGIEDVEPFTKLEEHLSVALTDFRDWRITQIRRNPLAAELSKEWGRDNKVLYLNYPRFLRLGMPEPPRLATFEKLKRFSPELVIRDSADILDDVRQLHDAYSLACLRRAVAITREGLVEGLRAIRPGSTEKEIMETVRLRLPLSWRHAGFPYRGSQDVHDGPPPNEERSRRFHSVCSPFHRQCFRVGRYGAHRYGRRVQPPLGRCPALHAGGRQVLSRATPTLRNSARGTKGGHREDRTGRNLVGASQPGRKDAS